MDYLRRRNCFEGTLLAICSSVREAPPIATWRLLRVTDKEVEFVAKDTKAGLLVPKRVALSQFVRLLAAHVPNRYRHGIRYFGLQRPVQKACPCRSIRPSR